MKRKLLKIHVTMFITLFCCISLIKAQNINIPENWIHADSIRCRALHVGDSSINISNTNIISSTLAGAQTIFIEPFNGTFILKRLNTPQSNCNMNIGTDANTYKLHLHDGTNTSNKVNPYIHFTNFNTGLNTTDGFRVGIASNGSADLIQSEALPIANFVS
jgi:hypothetical protein